MSINFIELLNKVACVARHGWNNEFTGVASWQ